jgi:hypothetical protein
MFLVSDGRGDIAAHNVDGQGLYWRDTRFLSLYELRLGTGQPQLLSSTGEHNFMTTLQFGNPAFQTADGRAVPARSISIRRNRFLFEGLHERIGFFNYNPFPVQATVRLTLGSDFRDMFDVRGYAIREDHGTIAAPLLSKSELWLAYHGLDGVERRTQVRFEPTPTRLEELTPDQSVAEAPRELEGISGRGEPRVEVPIRPPVAFAVFELELPPRAPYSLTVSITPHLWRPSGEEESRAPSAISTEPMVPALDRAYEAIRGSYNAWDAECTAIRTDHECAGIQRRPSGVVI